MTNFKYIGSILNTNGDYLKKPEGAGYSNAGIKLLGTLNTTLANRCKYTS